MHILEKNFFHDFWVAEDFELTYKNFNITNKHHLKGYLMPLSHFGEFDCYSPANQFAAQSQRSLNAVSVQSQRSLSAFAAQSPRSLRRVAEHGESFANALRIDFYYCRRKKKHSFS